MRRLLVRLGAPLVFGTGLGVLVATPATAAPGFDLNVTELPGAFRAGAGAERVTAVVSTTNDGCRKVLWSLVLRVDGLRLNQLRIDRIEQNGSFPVRISTDGNTARITDSQVDPGTLCRGRTVTAQYRVAVAGDVTDGRITFRHEAYDADRQLLAQTSAAREIVSDRSRPDRADRAERRPSPSASVESETRSPTEEPVDPAAEESAAGAAGPADPPGAGTDQAATAGTSGGSGLVTVGFVIGGLLLFLGVGLLLRLRRRLLGDDSLGVGDGLATAPAGGFGGSRARTVPRGGARGAASGRRRRSAPTRYYHD